MKEICFQAPRSRAHPLLVCPSSTPLRPAAAAVARGVDLRSFILVLSSPPFPSPSLRFVTKAVFPTSMASARSRGGRSGAGQLIESSSVTRVAASGRCHGIKNVFDDDRSLLIVRIYSGLKSLSYKCFMNYDINTQHKVI